MQFNFNGEENMMSQRIQQDSKTSSDCNFTSVPEELKYFNQWVIWRYEVRGDKRTKVLYRPSNPNKKAKSNESLTWGSFDQAQEVFQKGQADGIGFVFTKDDPYVGIDLDNCVNQDGKLESWAQEIVKQLNSYTEWSPSGKGLHIILKGQLPKGRRRKDRIEMYDSGRFFTMTGKPVEENPVVVEERSTALTQFHERVFGSRGGSKKKATDSGGFKGAGLTDEEILAKAKTAKNGEAFSKLFEGKYKGDYPSQSEADIALCSKLAFWAGPNPEQIDRIFRQAKLYRKKWDEQHGEKTYGAMTIEKTIEERTEFYGKTNDPLADFQDHHCKKGKAPNPPNIAEGFLTQGGYRNEEGLRLRWHRQEWLRFNGKVFSPVPNHDLRAEVMAFIQSGPIRPHATKTLLNNVITNLEGMCLIPSTVSFPAMRIDREWVPCPNHVVLANGILNLNRLLEGEINASLTLHTPTFVSKVELPFGFEPQAQCPRWVKFLDQVLPDPECRQLLRELFGYCLTYDTSFQKFFLFEGNGGNGKGVVLRILEALLGRANISSLPLEIFGESHGLESTLGKLVNITSDFGEFHRIGEGLLKQFTGDDLMHFNPKYRDPFTAKPTAKLIIATNVLPKFGDRSEGLWRRLILVPFPVSIPEEDQNRNLTEELKEELPGILNWAINGGYTLRQRGHFLEPTRSQKARKEFQRETNPARIFLEENYELDSTSHVSIKEMYMRYTDFCEAGNYRPLNEAHFGREVRKVFPEVHKVRKSTVTTGSIACKPHRYRAYEGISQMLEED